MHPLGLAVLYAPLLLHASVDAALRVLALSHLLFFTGGIRKVIVPPELGFGSEGAVLRPTVHVPEKQGAIPPGATLEYELSLQRVSIPPS